MKNLKLIASIVFFFTLNIGFSQEKETQKPGWKINNDKVLIRNQTAFFVLDGVPVTQEIGEKINPEHIESINVLKKDKSVALFGERGGNGAVIIKTKRGFENEIKALQKMYTFEFSPNKKGKKITISGLITDCEDLILPTVEITNLNSKEKAFSDFEGKYSIATHKNDVLECTFPGYESQRILVHEKSEINIKLKVSPKISEGNIMVKKPVIYLYPTQKTEVNFKFDFKGKIHTTFPKYENNWSVTAYPDGKIFDKKTNRFYNSLFWDGEHKLPVAYYDYTAGFVVSKNNLADFLIQKLEYIGLNTSETNDFVQYWLPILEKNETNFIHFRVNNDYDVISKNTITPKPDTSIRIFMEFYALDKPISIPEQTLPKTERKGFTVVEWGGGDVSDVVEKSDEL